MVLDVGCLSNNVLPQSLLRGREGITGKGCQWNQPMRIPWYRCSAAAGVFFSCYSSINNLYQASSHSVLVTLSYLPLQCTQILLSWCSHESRSNEKYSKGISLFLLTIKKTWDIYLRYRCPWSRCLQLNEINPLPTWLTLWRCWYGSNIFSRHTYKELKELESFIFFWKKQVIFKF